ncbi:2TM domain-containing protein [Methanobrevibacter arboriphilus]|uniref:2TM domain-containing protein n=1 Tax=Methanobrevibacter arboriphilus TaxID=39441 RepID=UPI0005B2952C|nr:2TM domain-containing protein [Methanobrevibacter arboriphilus]
MSTNTKYQKAKIIVEETRRLYLQIILLVGIFLFIIVRTIISRNFLLMPSFTFIGENVSYSPELSIIQSPFFIFAYVAVIFSIFIVFRYIKLYNLKRKFRSGEKGIKKLKKYMKTDKIPNKEEVDNKFDEDKNKAKRKFYILVIRVAVLNFVLYYVFTNYISNSFLFFNIILPFSILTLIYRYLLLFHADKKFLGEKWENEKIEYYISEFN